MDESAGDWPNPVRTIADNVKLTEPGAPHLASEMWDRSSTPSPHREPIYHGPTGTGGDRQPISTPFSTAPTCQVKSRNPPRPDTLARRQFRPLRVKYK
jgi:hypothetical protein